MTSDLSSTLDISDPHCHNLHTKVLGQHPTMDDSDFWNPDVDIGPFKAITDARICHNGSLTTEPMYFHNDRFTSPILHPGAPIEKIDFKDRIIAPAFIELQTNGCLGMHFINFEDERSYGENLEKVSMYLVEKGVGGFYVTLPTVEPNVFQRVSFYLPRYTRIAIFELGKLLNR